MSHMLSRAIIGLSMFLALLLPPLHVHALELPSIPPIPENISGQDRIDLAKLREELLNKRNALASKVQSHNQQCSNVLEGSPEEASCSSARAQIEGELKAYQNAVKAYKGKIANAQAEASAKQKEVANVSMIKGEVKFRKKDHGDWVPINLNTPLAPGDEVMTGSRSMAQIRFSDGSLVELGPHSIFTLEKSDGKETFSEMLKGIMHLFIRPQRISPFDSSIRGSLEIRTPIATVSVRGTDFVVELEPDGSGLITVLEGEVAVEGLGDGQVIVVPDSHQVRVSKDGMVQSLDSVNLSSLNRWWESQK